ncbi:MAG: hypothetical protein MJ252_12795 [archaeon]|nr:hypothetical protein [archaeon]
MSGALKESSEILQVDDPCWGLKLKNYYENKNNYPKGVERFKPMTNKEIKRMETEYNPITQKYKDKEKEKELNKEYKNNLSKTIISNYDKQLQNEQIYNIITKENKLEALGYKEILKDKKVLNKEISNVPYNIISNISLNKHNTIPPNQRKKYEEYEDNKNIKIKENSASLRECRNFNIINNKYFNHHLEKIKTEKEIENLNAAKKFLERHDYDIVNNRYYDKEKEIEGKMKEKEKREEWLKTHKDRTSVIRNPINNYIYDKELQDKIDLKEKNAKKRYTIKNEMEMFYHNKDKFNSEKETNRAFNRRSYLKYAIEDERGYDIINDEDIYRKQKENLIKKGKEPRNFRSDWERLLEGKGTNETFSKKSLYKSSFDTSDLEIDKFNYDKLREKRLKTLPNLNEDERFNLSKRNNKIDEHKKYINDNRQYIRTEGNREIYPYNNKLWGTEKNNWFEGKRNYPSINNSNYLINSNLDIGVRGEHGPNMMNRNNLYLSVNQ